LRGLLADASDAVYPDDYETEHDSAEIPELEERRERNRTA
jgi:hypothetical protein